MTTFHQLRSTKEAYSSGVFQGQCRNWKDRCALNRVAPPALTVAMHNRDVTTATDTHRPGLDLGGRRGGWRRGEPPRGRWRCPCSSPGMDLEERTPISGVNNTTYKERWEEEGELTWISLALQSFIRTRPKMWSWACDMGMGSPILLPGPTKNALIQREKIKLKPVDTVLLHFAITPSLVRCPLACTAQTPAAFLKK